MRKLTNVIQRIFAYNSTLQVIYTETWGLEGILKMVQNHQ